MKKNMAIHDYLLIVKVNATLQVYIAKGSEIVRFPDIKNYITRYKATHKHHKKS